MNRGILSEKGGNEMREKILRFLNGQLIPSVLYLVLGLCLILVPVETVQILSKAVFGCVMIAAGVFHLWMYLAKRRGAIVLDLFSGVTVMVVGIFLFSNPQIVVKILTIMLGSFLIVDSIWTLQLGYKMKKYQRGKWICSILLSLIFAGLGVVLIWNPFQERKITFMFAGWAFLVNGGMDLLLMLFQGNFNRKVENGKYTMLSKEEKASIKKAKKEKKKLEKLQKIPKEQPLTEEPLEMEMEILPSEEPIQEESVEAMEVEMVEKEEKVLEEWQD